MFDFGHLKSHKELKDSNQSTIKPADEPTFHLTLKVIRYRSDKPAVPFLAIPSLYSL